MEFPAPVLISYLEGRPLLPVVRRILNVLLSASLASFVFEHYYFRYQWLDITDYKAELTFLIKGQFFVPFSIFIVVHYLLAFLCWFCFSVFTTRKSNEISATIIRPGLRRVDFRKIIRFFNRFSILFGKKLKEKEVYDWIKIEFGGISEELWQQHLGEIARLKIVAQANFQLACKALVTTAVYFFSISYFGVVLFIVTVLSLSVAAIVLYYAYILLDVWPKMVSHVRSRVDIILATRAANNT